MIDLMIWGASSLYHKFHERGHSGGWSPAESRDKVLELAQICHEENQKIYTMIQNLDNDVQRLGPANVRRLQHSVYWLATANVLLLGGCGALVFRLFNL